jgi:hypothetical protein
MLEAEVNGIETRGIAHAVVCPRTTTRYLAPAIHRSLSLSDVKQQGLQVGRPGAAPPTQPTLDPIK